MSDKLYNYSSFERLARDTPPPFDIDEKLSRHGGSATFWGAVQRRRMMTYRPNNCEVYVTGPDYDDEWDGTATAEQWWRWAYITHSLHVRTRSGLTIPVKVEQRGGMFGIHMMKLIASIEEQLECKFNDFLGQRAARDKLRQELNELYSVTDYSHSKGKVLRDVGGNTYEIEVTHSNGAMYQYGLWKYPDEKLSEFVGEPKRDDAWGVNCRNGVEEAWSHDYYRIEKMREASGEIPAYVNLWHRFLDNIGRDFNRDAFNEVTRGHVDFCNDIRVKRNWSLENAQRLNHWVNTWDEVCNLVANEFPELQFSNSRGTGFRMWIYW